MSASERFAPFTSRAVGGIVGHDSGFFRVNLSLTRDRLTCEPFMSADDSSRLASDPPPTDDHDKVQPTVRDALIGAAIGLLLIYAGTRISYWILRWLVIGVGLMFVGAMSAFVISVIWTKVSPRAHMIMSRARGHVDPKST